jgi:hypothetical protein
MGHSKGSPNGKIYSLSAYVKNTEKSQLNNAASQTLRKISTE